MRTAEEIILSNFNAVTKVQWSEMKRQYPYSELEYLINEARRECIDECANDAFDSIIKGYDTPEAVKQSIINLKEQTK